MPRLLLVALLSLIALSRAMAAPTLPIQAGETPSTEQPAPAVAPVVDERYSSPAATLKTFMTEMTRAAEARPEDRDTILRNAARCLNLPRLTGTLGPNRAAMLRFVIDRIGPTWVVRLPDKALLQANPVESQIYFPHPDVPRHEEIASLVGEDLEIVLRRQPNGEWKFSRQTVDDITALYVRTRGLTGGVPTPMVLQTREMQIRQFIPPTLQIGRIVSIEYWQLIGITSLVFIGLVIDYFSRFVFAVVWRALTGKDKSDKEILQRTVRPFGLLVAALFWYWTLPFLFLPPTALQVLLIAARVFASLAAVMVSFRLADLLTDFFIRRAKSTATHLDDLLLPLARRSIKIVVVILAAVYIAESFDVEIVPLLTGLGIGGLAFAFAAKDTIENFFGSIAVIADRPFVAGDWVVIDDVEGTVEQLGLRSTRIRTFYNSLVTVPNATLVRATVDNYGRRRFRRYRTILNVTYGTSPDKIEAFCEGIRELIRQHPFTRKDYYHVWLNSFGAHSLDILVYMFHEAPEWGTELRERHRFMLDIIRLANRLGVEFAFPTQTLHLVRDDPNAEPTEYPSPKKLTEFADRRGGRDEARSIVKNQHWRAKRPAPVRYDGDPEVDEAKPKGE